MSKTLQELEHEITETSEALGEAEYENGVYQSWASFYATDMPQETSSLSFCRASGRETYDQGKVLAARLNGLYLEYRTMGGTREAFVKLCLDPTSNNWGILLFIDEFPWISKEEWNKVYDAPSSST